MSRLIVIHGFNVWKTYGEALKWNSSIEHAFFHGVTIILRLSYKNAHRVSVASLWQSSMYNFLLNSKSTLSTKFAQNHTYSLYIQLYMWNFMVLKYVRTFTLKWKWHVIWLLSFAIWQYRSWRNLLLCVM